MSNSEISVNRSIKIIKRATKKGISLSEASRQNELGRNYVSDVKLRLFRNLERRNITRQSFSEFQKTLKEYQKKLDKMKNK
jgi:lambda repressor-like predicted transcriptional regulator